MFTKLKNSLQLIIFKSLLWCGTVFVILWSSQLYAQNNDIQVDSLVSKETQLFISQSDSIEKIKDMIFDSFEIEKDTLLSLAYSRLFLERGNKEDNSGIQHYSSYQIGYIRYVQGEYLLAIRYANSAVKLAEKRQDTYEIITSNTLMGAILYNLGEYDASLESYLRAKSLYTQMQDDQYILCLVNIANVRIKLHHFSDALDDYNNVLAILDEKDESSFAQYLYTYLSTLLGKSLSLTRLEKYNEAETVCKKGIQLAKANNKPTYKGGFYVNLGVIYFDKKEYHTSLDFLRKGREILQQNDGLQNNIFIADFYIAQNYNAQEKYTEAIDVLDSIFSRATDDSSVDRIEEMYQLAIDISEIIERPKEQINHYYARSNRVKDKKNDQQLRAKDLLHEDDTNDYKIENERLSSENTKNQLDKKIAVIISAIVITVLLLAFYFHYRKSKQNEQKFLAIIDNISKQANKKTEETSTSHSTIKNEKAHAILEQLEALEETEFYLSQEATLHSTAKLLNTNTTYLSKALNDVKKQSFSQYLNKLRIDYVLVKLKEDSVFRSYTIHAISTEIGYKSTTTFIKEFKNKTGLNPSYYIKKIDE